MKVSKRLSKSIISLLLICTIVITPFTSLMTTMANEITQVKETNSSSYDVTFTAESQWDKTYQGNIIIKNKGNLPINNWSLTFDMEHQISNIWNATIGSHSGTTYVINNAGHNKDIAPGQSVVIGYQASFTSKINLPSTYNLSFKQQELELNQENIFHGEGYDVEFHVNNQWDGAFNGEITIVNHTQVSIDNWAIQFNFDHEITNIWNAVVNKHNGNTYIIKNADFNQDIAAEQSVTFGFEAKYKDIVTSPTNFDLLMKEEDVSTSDYTIDFRVTSDWGSAFNGEISITNNTDVSIEDWNLEFDFDHKIERFWTATIISEEDNHYIVKNAVYNANIKPGQTLVLGFGGNPGNVSGKPTNFKLSKIALDNPSNNEIIEDPEVIATDVQKQKAKESLLNWTEPDLPALQAEFNDEFQKAQDLYYKGLQLENQDRYQEAQGAYLDLLIALDNKKKKLDEVNQILEEVRSDPYGDYDQDGLLNGYEISAFYGYMNPMVARSNEDGLSDGEDDFDLDGLSNLEEQGYGTSPVNSDTDDDGINDKRELELGLDPLNPNDSQNLVRQMISLDDTGIRIEITAQGDAEGKVSAAKAEDSFESTYAVTDFYEISTDVKYDSAKINIPVDFSKIESYNYNKLWIMYYDVDLGGFLPLENTMIDAYNGYVSAVTNQLSTYAVFYVDSWNNYFNVPVNQTTKVTAGTITIKATQTGSLDSDKDGIPDSMEKEGIRVGTSKKLIYTNPYDADSDNDGLLDGEEIDVKNPIETTILWIYRVTWYRMRSNPNLADTDNDKLNDYKEIKTYNTNPLKYDTDGDKLNDYLECTVYKTNPNLMDTDKDSIHDYDECSNSNYDPLVFDTVIKAKRTYIIDKNTTLKGRVHIQAPIVVNEDVSLTLSNIINIYIESIKSKATWESNVFTVYGNLYANDESKKGTHL